MMYYRAIIECGHVGAGKSLDVVRYFRAGDPVDLFSAAARMPRAKGKARGTAVKLLERVSREEYDRGRKRSHSNPYLKVRKNGPSKKRSAGIFH